jgi:mutator protein MutT
MIPVVAAVIERGGRYLVCQRPHEKAHGGLWEFPGGKMLQGEGGADAIARELSEELGVRVHAVGQVLSEVPDDNVGVRIRFLAVSICGEPRLLEHAALCWAEPADLLLLPLAPADSMFVREVLGV